MESVCTLSKCGFEPIQAQLMPNDKPCFWQIIVYGAAMLNCASSCLHEA
jgi:hypothetical protein